MKRLKLIKFHSSSELSESLCETGGSDAAAVIVNALQRSYLRNAPGGGKIPFFLRARPDN
jgi:hypothetical protein